jgi:hypothetical protein
MKIKEIKVELVPLKMKSIVAAWTYFLLHFLDN